MGATAPPRGQPNTLNRANTDTKRQHQGRMLLANTHAHNPLDMTYSQLEQLFREQFKCHLAPVRPRGRFRDRVVEALTEG